MSIVLADLTGIFRLDRLVLSNSPLYKAAGQE